jgi:[glutamine synthetase] adenylyltransferase / [glutamine synthetase]-adenylyl-L-tyrosine phosphorylase
MFADEKRAQELIDRICVKLNRSMEDDLWRLFEDWPNGEDGLARLERIAGSMSGAGVFADQLVLMPELAAIFVSVICTSSHLSDLIIQNPEFVSLLLDPEVLGRHCDRNHVLEEGHRLLANATNYTHSLDRLRFLKQEHTVILAAQDIGELMVQPEIWRGISELAIGLVTLAQEVTWKQFRKRGNYPEQCPIGIGVLGKLGGLELNYSSDIDLVFVVGEGIDEEGARKYCEFFRSAVADRMGRGDLYRVDLRLRPFGSQGPIASAKQTFEKYYAQYAEPWEQVALIRSFLISPNADLVQWWESMRDRVVFAGARSEMALGNLLKMRRRAEEEVDESDLKRGAGGIRDVELCVQVMQLLNGNATPTLKGRSTVEMLSVGVEAGLFDQSIGRSLIENYIFLRRLEHRVQILANRQVYSLPENLGLRDVVARSLGYSRVGNLEDEIVVRRREVRRGFETVFGPLMGDTDSNFGADLMWLATVKGGSDYSKALSENESSRGRLELVAQRAPALIPYLQQSPGILEQVLSGEIQEEVDAQSSFMALCGRYDRDDMQRALRNSWLRTNLHSFFVEDSDFGSQLMRHFDAAIGVLARHWGSSVSVIGLGSYAAGEMSPDSDADLLVLVGDESEREMVERSLQASVIELGKLKALGAPFEVDFRLRPEGRHGRLAVTPEGLQKYAATFMEPWERFALGRSRVVFGGEFGRAILREVAYGEVFSGEEFDSLLHMKERIERERVKPGMRDRHIKLGRGGLDDIVWLAQLWMLRRADRVLSLEEIPTRTVDRLRLLLNERFLDVVEYDALKDGFEYLNRVRKSLYLMGVGDDLFPENPDRLVLLGENFGLDDPNDMLALQARHARRIRGIFEEGILRLKAL